MTAIEAAGRGMMAAAARLDADASAVAEGLSGDAGATDAATAPRPAHTAQASLIQGGVDAVQATVDQAQALSAFKANVAAFEAADRMMKALVDLKS